MKYGIMMYSTCNLGDEIQSLAASRFLPRQELEKFIYVNREAMRSFSSNEPVKMILNGWYMHHPDQWPPSGSIHPLLVAMHFQQSQSVLECVGSKAGKEFLLRHGPVGTRDLATLKLLQTLGIPAYFSGCLTLTLPKFADVNRSEFILAVDISPELVKFIGEKTERPIYQLSPTMAFNLMLSPKEKFLLAEYLLRIYQQAYCVVTSRLHVAMPCLALGTPVLLINDAADQYRFSGLKELTWNMEEAAYRENYEQFDLDHPPENPMEYMIYRKQIIKKCEDFMGVPAEEVVFLNGDHGQSNIEAAFMQLLIQKIVFRRS